jgi:peptide/nickel transport system permease protein/glutathione transport system permease protein
MLQGLMVIYCFLIVVVNLITDLTYGLIDPRVKHA